jgi:hypothetical protein
MDSPARCAFIADSYRLECSSVAAFTVRIAEFSIKTQFKTCFALKGYQVQHSTGRWDILTRFSSGIEH